MLKKVIFIVLVFLTVLTGVSQDKKNYYEASFGFQNLRNKTVFSIQPYFDCANGAYSLLNIKEESLNLPSLSFLKYHPTQIRDLYFISGVGFNQKGFEETATLVPWENRTNVQSYSVKHVLSYLAMQMGFNYSFLRYKYARLSISQIMNSEMMLRRIVMNGDYPYDIFDYKVNAFSSATFLNMDVPFNKSCGLVIKLFFQTALTNYNVARRDFNGNLLHNNYRPFGYGLLMGLSF